MKKLFLAAIFLLPTGLLHAFDYGQKINSSHSDVATGSNLPVMISSANINFEAVTISSPAAGSMVVFYRSTGSTFTADLATWTKVNCDYQTVNTNPVTIPLFDMESSSYTFMQVIGACSRTVWFRFISPHQDAGSTGRYKNFGLPQNGQR